MSWFERLMGFREVSPEQVRDNIDVNGPDLVSRVNGRRVRWGRLSVPSLGELRSEVDNPNAEQRTTVRELIGDVKALHRDPQNAGALVQAASQFNLLEMTGPRVTPERGVGIYEGDPTQGPACAIACGGGTIYRNYFVPLAGGLGQTAERQIDCLAELREALGGPGLWEMQNGYALPSVAGLERVNERLTAVSSAERDALRGLLRIGVQHDVEVLGTEHRLTQVYGSAMPVGYGKPPSALWEPLARLVLEASYEATLLAARREGIEVVYLTLLGGGVFRNWPEWIADAVLRALDLVGGLDVRLVSYRRSNPAAQEIVARHGA